jgi:hypothetical protein
VVANLAPGILLRLADAGGRRQRRPTIFGIGAEPGHEEHRSPITKLPTDASG